MRRNLPRKRDQVALVERPDVDHLAATLSGEPEGPGARGPAGLPPASFWPSLLYSPAVLPPVAAPLALGCGSPSPTPGSPPSRKSILAAAAQPSCRSLPAVRR